MPLDFENKQFIGCIPLSRFPTHPTDQSPCEIWECPTCKEPMWVSKLKRDHYALHPETVEIHCFECIIKESIEQGYKTELQDISKVN